MSQQENASNEKKARANRGRESTEADLLAVLYRNHCPDPQHLGEYHLGYLAEPEQTALQAHLDRCPHCRAELEGMIRFLAEDPSSSSFTGRDKALAWTQARGFQWRWGEAGQIIIHLLTAAASTLSPPAAPVPVKGHLSKDEEVIRRITLSPDQTGDLELAATIRQNQADPDTCTLLVRVEIPSRWPELAGTLVSATADSWQVEGKTDENGEMVFTGLPVDLIDNLVIEVNPSP